MRRSGAPSLRRKDAPEKSNLDILALLNSNSQSLNQSNLGGIKHNSFVPPSQKDSKSPGIQVSQFQSPKSNFASPVQKSSIQSAFTNSSPLVPLPVNLNQELVSNDVGQSGFSMKSNFTAPTKPSATSSCSFLGYNKPFTTNSIHEPRIDESESSSNDDATKYFSCVWCKKSGRKHKKWEGDGFVKES